MSNTIITKYRPDTFDVVIGNKEVVGNLAKAVRSPSRPKAYLFIGNAGIGKTTLARIVAKEVNSVIDDIDAASSSSVDDVRNLKEKAGFKPLFAENMTYIIDECHRLSAQAWDALLKLIEEPPSFLYICLCTTNPKKVPATIRSRCYEVQLKPVSPNEISELLEVVAECEGWKVDGNIMQGIILAADGGVRRALSLLQAGHAAKDREELKKLINKVDIENSPIAEICSLLIDKNKSWERIRKLLTQIEDEEEAIDGASRYLTAAMFRATSPEQACHIWNILEALTTQNTYDKKVQLACVVGRMLWTS